MKLTYNPSQNNGQYIKFLYSLLFQRTEDESISHKKMPSYENHCTFINSKPYLIWSVVTNVDNLMIGSFYISYHDEIGIFIDKAYRGRGYGTEILKHLLEVYPYMGFLANINPKNHKAIRLYAKEGFKPLQNTYHISPKP